MRWHKVRNKGYEKMKREELHKLLFETLCIIDDICKKENVRWFLDSGTEIGSLREQNIIPWDDDIDIKVMSICILSNHRITARHFTILFQESMMSGIR